MTNINFELEWPNIYCLIPIYDHLGGNSTELWLSGGKRILIPYKTKTVVRNLAKVFAVDVSQLKRNYGVFVGRKVSIPLALHPELILIPLKIREPFAKDEGAIGYVVLNKIVGSSPGANIHADITFHDGSRLETLQGLNSVNLAIAHGEIVSRECKKNLQTSVQEKEELYRILSAIVSRSL